MLAGLVLVLGACATTGEPGGDPSVKEVTARVEQWWEHVRKGETEMAYGLLSPASRSTINLDTFRKRNAGGRWWRSMKILDVDCRADTCQVRMAVEYDLYEIKGLNRTIEETWIKDAGTWWLVAGR